jgi:hypothetical protein
MVRIRNFAYILQVIFPFEAGKLNIILIMSRYLEKQLYIAKSEEELRQLLKVDKIKFI